MHPRPRIRKSFCSMILVSNMGASGSAMYALLRHYGSLSRTRTASRPRSGPPSWIWIVAADSRSGNPANSIDNDLLLRCCANKSSACFRPVSVPLKMNKRQMYRRVGFRLLMARVERRAIGIFNACEGGRTGARSSKVRENPKVCTENAWNCPKSGCLGLSGFAFG